MSGGHLVIGASGQVGSHLVQALLLQGEAVTAAGYSKAGPGMRRLDITDRDATASAIAALRPRVVWIPAAMPDVDRCQTEPEQSFAVNVEGVQNVGRAADLVQAKVVFFSTDYVFDGTGGPYAEDDAPHPIQTYGAHKRQAEEWLAANLPNSLIIRTAWIYSEEEMRRNFVYRIVEDLRAGRVVRAAVDQVNTPTPAKGLAERSIRAALDDWSGIVHITGPRRMTRYALTCAICQRAGFDPALIVPIAIGDLDLPAKRPLNGGLYSTRLAAMAPDPELTG